jgi:hypothetical protein
MEWLRRRRATDGPVIDRSLVERRLPILAGLEGDSLDRLLTLAGRFLARKKIETVGDCALDDDDPALIALQACLPVLELGLDWYRGWSTVLVYPDEFVAPREEMDETGIVHRYDEVLSGESWDKGPVVLSLTGLDESGWGDGHNVVIHEMAHKLDMRNGDPNGYPPLHAGMERAAWTAAFQAAFDDLNARIDSDQPTAVDDYAATSPGECFAVMCEAFFETPRSLRRAYPSVYEQLRGFFRQDPGQRLAT